LAAQLDANGDTLPDSGGVATDWGLTIDALLALAASGQASDQAHATAGAIAGSGEQYIGAPADVATKWPAIAKTALALEVAGLDPTAHPAPGGARDLIAELVGVMNNDGSFGSSDMVFSHALAVIALARTSAGSPPGAVNWMANQRCANQADPAFGAYGWGSGCSGSEDVDVTALAIHALIAANVPASDPAVQDAAAWLATQQDAAGGFLAWGAANANSTAMAASALALVPGHTAAIAKAAEYLGSLQVSCAIIAAQGSPLGTADLGAVAFDLTALTDAKQFGIDAIAVGQFQRAGAQAALASMPSGLGGLSISGAAAPAARTCTPAGANPQPAPGQPKGGTPLPPTGADAGLPVMAGAAALMLVGALLVWRRRATTSRSISG
jgi:hypothetical protein